MYRNILLPIDGSQLSLRAAGHGIELARALNARVTVIMVTTPWATQFAREVAVVVPGVLVPQNEYDLRTETSRLQLLARRHRGGEKRRTSRRERCTSGIATLTSPSSRLRARKVAT